MHATQGLMASTHAPRSTRRVCYSVAQLQKMRRSGDSKTTPRGRINAALVRLAKRNERETLALFAPGLFPGLLNELSVHNGALQEEIEKLDFENHALTTEMTESFGPVIAHAKSLQKELDKHKTVLQKHQAAEKSQKQLNDEQNQKLQRTEDERDMLEKALNDAEEKITEQTALLQAGVELRHWDNTFQDYMHTFGDVGREFQRACERVVNEDRGGLREVAHLWDKVQDYFEEIKELRDKMHTLHVAAKERFEEEDEDDDDDDESLYEDAPAVMD